MGRSPHQRIRQVTGDEADPFIPFHLLVISADEDTRDRMQGQKQRRLAEMSCRSDRAWAGQRLPARLVACARTSTSYSRTWRTASTARSPVSAWVSSNTTQWWQAQAPRDDHPLRSLELQLEGRQPALFLLYRKVQPRIHKVLLMQLAALRHHRRSPSRVLPGPGCQWTRNLPAARAQGSMIEGLTLFVTNVAG